MDLKAQIISLSSPYNFEFQDAQKDICNLLFSSNFQEEVIDQASSRFIEWKFILPHSPHLVAYGRQV